MDDFLEPGPSLTLFAGLPEECPALNHIAVTVDVAERDPISDDVFTPVTMDYVLNCPVILAQAQRTNYAGLVSNGIFTDTYRTSSQGEIYNNDQAVALGDDPDAGSLSWIASVRLVPR
jgi:hypothetical protein